MSTANGCTPRGPPEDAQNVSDQKIDESAAAPISMDADIMNLTFDIVVVVRLPLSRGKRYLFWPQLGDLITILRPVVEVAKTFILLRWELSKHDFVESEDEEDT